MLLPTFQVFPMVGNYILVYRTAAWLSDKVKYKELKLGFIRRAPNCREIELMLLIAPMSSPAIGNINVGGSCVDESFN